MKAASLSLCGTKFPIFPSIILLIILVTVLSNFTPVSPGDHPAKYYTISSYTKR